MEEVEIVSDHGLNETDLEWAFDALNLTVHHHDDDFTSATKRKLQNLRAVASWVMRYVAPTIVALGLLGNLTSFVLLVASSLRHLSRSVYLAAMCLTDQSFLILLVLASRSMAAVELYNQVDALCKLLIYVVHLVEVGKLFAVLLAADAYIACQPRLAARLCRPKSALIAVLSTTAAVAVYSTHALTQIGTSASGRYCRYHDYSVTVRMHIADVTLLSVLPIAVLAALCVATCVHKRRRPVSTSPSAASSTLALPVAVTIIYTLTLLPVIAMHCMAIYDYMHPGTFYHYYEYYFYVQQLVHAFSYLFFTCKCLLYVSCWKPYRNALIDCSKNLWHQRVRLYGRVPYSTYGEDVSMTTVT